MQLYQLWLFYLYTKCNLPLWVPKFEASEWSAFKSLTYPYPQVKVGNTDSLTVSWVRRRSVIPCVRSHRHPFDAFNEDCCKCHLYMPRNNLLSLLTQLHQSLSPLSCDDWYWWLMWQRRGFFRTSIFPSFHCSCCSSLRKKPISCLFVTPINSNVNTVILRETLNYNKILHGLQMPTWQCYLLYFFFQWPKLDKNSATFLRWRNLYPAIDQSYYLLPSY